MIICLSINQEEKKRLRIYYVGCEEEYYILKKKCIPYPKHVSVNKNMNKKEVRNLVATEALRSHINPYNLY